MNIILMYCSCFFWLFLPGFMYVSFGGGLGLGSMIAALLQVFLFVAFKSSLPIYINRLLLLYFLFFSLIVLNSIFPAFSIIGFKQIGLFIFIILAMFCAAIFVAELKSWRAIKLIEFFEHMVVIIVLWTLTFYFISFPFMNYDGFSKQMFPYAEPSHYLLSCGFILFVAGAVVSFKYRVVSLCLLIFIGIVMPSVIALVLGFFYLIHFRSLFTAKGLFWSVLLGILVSLGLYYLLGGEYYINNAGYYLNRVDFSADNTNLSALVYIQGFSLIISNLNEYPLGLGQLNIGKEPPIDISLLIYDLAGEFKNRTDGGFLASKFISEFGFLGLCIVIFYLVHWSQLLFRLIFKREHYNEFELICMSGYLVFIVELFLRGTGYLSFGVLLLFIYLINVGKTYRSI